MSLQRLIGVLKLISRCGGGCQARGGPAERNSRIRWSDTCLLATRAKLVTSAPEPEGKSEYLNTSGSAAACGILQVRQPPRQRPGWRLEYLPTRLCAVGGALAKPGMQSRTIH